MPELVSAQDLIHSHIRVHAAALVGIMSRGTSITTGRLGMNGAPSAAGSYVAAWGIMVVLYQVVRLLGGVPHEALAVFLSPDVHPLR